MEDKRLQQGFFIALLVLVTAAFIVLLSGYLLPIFWAATLGVLFYPVKARIAARLKGRSSAAAFITTLLILATVIVPVFALVSAVAAEASQLYARIQRGELDPAALLRWVESMAPQVVEWAGSLGIDFEQIRSNLSQAAVRVSQYVGNFAFAAGQNALAFTVAFFVMLYVLFFVLRDGDRILELMIRALPLGDERERLLFSKFAEVSRATIKGTVVIGMIQGALGGLIFALLGIGGAVFWGVVMAVLSLLPAVGAGLVWAPAALLLAINGAWGKALVLTLFGALVIGLVDNLLRPVLVGRDTRMPDYLVLLSTLGGLGLFGVSGFVIGPVIAALFLAFWVMFEQEHHPDFQPPKPSPGETPGAGPGPDKEGETP
jgi:predicted PurR-regulated permease PerM